MKTNQKVAIQAAENQFKPTLSENTNQLAQQFRQKIAENIQEDKVSTFDWLAVAGKKEEWRK